METNAKVEELAVETHEQLEPTFLALVSEVTGAGPSGEQDARDMIVWGND